MCIIYERKIFKVQLLWQIKLKMDSLNVKEEQIYYKSLFFWL